MILGDYGKRLDFNAGVAVTTGQLAVLRCAAILIGEQALRRCFLQVLECGGRLLVGTTGLERMVVLYP
ncbi:hypothetical protein LGQ10_08705 [Pseudomonas sp. L5B5]|uniref:hypothetical protein n=1 Tax=Pseudomonas sp. L5B5 TaxID=2883205 RepID=UPI001CFB742A|nr:hypothetical protein [Pseudomonas sp. L5B5]UCZ86361.1 hypothetical protein LGQ10_08705 [Pseudomonas sp. L5B5]